MHALFLSVWSGKAGGLVSGSASQAVSSLQTLIDFSSSLTLMAPSPPPKYPDNFTLVKMLRILWEFPSEPLNCNSQCSLGRANDCSTTLNLKYRGGYRGCSSLFNIELSRIEEKMLFIFPSGISLLWNSLPAFIKKPFKNLKAQGEVQSYVWLFIDNAIKSGQP